MRIRKNAKFSSYYHTNLSNVANTIQLNENSSNLSCELNQSPWDVISYPSSDASFYQQFDEYAVYYDVNELLSAGNGSSFDSIRRFESVAVKTSDLGENDNVYGGKIDFGEYLGLNEEVEKIKVQEEIKLCGKSDEEGWQCGNVVQNGNKMCDKHLYEVQNWTTKKNFGPDTGSMTECRPRRAKKRDSSNPYEFYYYSGFGPSWGMKRGAVDMDSNGYNAASMDYDMDVQNEKEQGLELEMTEAGLIKAEMDSIAVDGDDEKGKVGIIGKRRGRKPIKERSLKSLM